MLRELKPRTYMDCCECDRPIPYMERRLRREIWQGGQILYGEDLHLSCSKPGKLAPLPFRSPENVRIRHKLMAQLRSQGYSFRECAYAVGLFDHKSATYHISGKCRCQL